MVVFGENSSKLKNLKFWKYQVKKKREINSKGHDKVKWVKPIQILLKRFEFGSNWSSCSKHGWIALFDGFKFKMSLNNEISSNMKNVLWILYYNLQ